ncbi:5710_t:CDS:2, partial [Acaulospora colombiana]
MSSWSYDENFLYPIFRAELIDVYKDYGTVWDIKVTNGITLQRSYFTSDLFVNEARADVDSLLCEFDHLAEGEAEPFVIFKQLWVKLGWNLAHLI